MKNITNITHLLFSMDEDKIEKKVVDEGYNNYRLCFPISYDKEILNNNFYVYQQMINEGYIKNEHQLTFNMLM